MHRTSANLREVRARVPAVTGCLASRVSARVELCPVCTGEDLCRWRLDPCVENEGWLGFRADTISLNHHFRWKKNFVENNRIN